MSTEDVYVTVFNKNNLEFDQNLTLSPFGGLVTITKVKDSEIRWLNSGLMAAKLSTCIQVEQRHATGYIK